MNQEIKEKIIKIIERSGLFHKQEDRGMSENNGYLYRWYKTELRFWTMYPRVSVSYNGETTFDTGVVTEDELLKILEEKEKIAREKYKNKTNSNDNKE